MNRDLSDTDWSILTSSSMDDSWTFFNNKIKEVINKFVPLTTVKKCKPPWFNQDILTLIKKKKNAFKRYANNKSAFRYKAYTTLRNLLNKKMKEAIRNHDSTIMNLVKKNPKKFWKHVNKKTKHTSNIGELINEDGSQSISNQEKASTLNKHFCKSFTKENTTNIPKSPEEDCTTCYIDNVIITETCVLKKLTDLNKDKSMGPDEIPGVILKKHSFFYF